MIDFTSLDTKTDKTGVSKQYYLFEKEDKACCPVEVFNQYLALAEARNVNSPHENLFKNVRSNKHKELYLTKQNIGKRTLSEYGQKIAEFLQLENPEAYTGHCFRRTAATLMANNGGNAIGMKQFFRWSSTKTASEYVQNSTRNKKNLSSLVNDTLGKTSFQKKRKDVTMIEKESRLSTMAVENLLNNASFSNCNVTVHIQPAPQCKKSKKTLSQETSEECSVSIDK